MTPQSGAPSSGNRKYTEKKESKKTRTKRGGPASGKKKSISKTQKNGWTRRRGFGTGGGRRLQEAHKKKRRLNKESALPDSKEIWTSTSDPRKTEV